MLDTDICIYISKQQPPEVKARFERLKPGQMVMSVITYGELYYGANKSNQKAKALAQLEGWFRTFPWKILFDGLRGIRRDSRGTRRAGTCDWKQRLMDRCPRDGPGCHPRDKQRPRVFAHRRAFRGKLDKIIRPGAFTSLPGFPFPLPRRGLRFFWFPSA